MTARPRPPWDIRQKTIAEAAAVTRKPGTPFHQMNMHGKSSGYQKRAYPEEDGNYYHLGYIVSPQRRGIYGR